jgi:hypothetical protein
MYIGNSKNSKFNGPGEMIMGKSHLDLKLVGIWKNGKLLPGKKDTEDGIVEIISMKQKAIDNINKKLCKSLI